jgi:hypothetical protein
MSSVEEALRAVDEVTRPLAASGLGGMKHRGNSMRAPRFPSLLEASWLHLSWSLSMRPAPRSVG